MTRRSWCCRFQGAPLGVRSGTVLGDPCDVDERRRQNKPQAPKSGGRSRRYKARIWTQEHTCVQHKSTVSWCAVSRGPKPMRPTGDQDCQIRLRRITKCEVRRRSFKSGIRQLMSGRPRPADFGLPPPPRASKYDPCAQTAGAQMVATPAASTRECCLRPWSRQAATPWRRSARRLRPLPVAACAWRRRISGD